MEVVSGDNRKILSNQRSCWRDTGWERGREGDSYAVYIDTDRCAVSPPSLKNHGLPSLIHSFIHPFMKTNTGHRDCPDHRQSLHMSRRAHKEGRIHKVTPFLSSPDSLVCCSAEVVFIWQQQYSVCCLNDLVSSWLEQANRIWYFSLFCLL